MVAGDAWTPAASVLPLATPEKSVPLLPPEIL